MASERNSPYLWPTWIAGLLAGDDLCRWAAWFRAHHTYAKLPRTNQGNLTLWKRDHAEMVQARAERLRADGWTVWVENQNKITMEGRVATLGGTPDITAIRGETEALVVDEKSGQPKDKDFWQVCIYMLTLPHVYKARFAGRVLSGQVEYRDQIIDIPAATFTAEARDRILRQIGETGGPYPPPRVPSFGECQFCDISAADCPDRVTEDPSKVTTDLF